MAELNAALSLDTRAKNPYIFLLYYINIFFIFLIYEIQCKAITKLLNILYITITQVPYKEFNNRREAKYNKYSNIIIQKFRHFNIKVTAITEFLPLPAFVVYFVVKKTAFYIISSKKNSIYEIYI